MPMVTPVLAALNFTSGVSLGIPYVRAALNFQQVAMYYASLLPNTTGANESRVAYITVDIPWCASNIVFECIDSAAVKTKLIIYRL